MILLDFFFIAGIRSLYNFPRTKNGDRYFIFDTRKIFCNSLVNIPEKENKLRSQNAKNLPINNK